MNIYRDKSNAHIKLFDYTKEKYAMPDEDAESVYAELREY